MSFFGWGNSAVRSGSTAVGFVSNPTTSAILAEIDFNGTNASVKAGGEEWHVTWIVAAQTTICMFALSQAQSTDLDMTQSTTYRDQTLVAISSGQSAQFVTKQKIERGDRLRVTMPSSVTCSVSAKIIAEGMA